MSTTETPEAALRRATAPLLAKLHALLPVDPTAAPEDLVQGCVVKAAGEWAGFQSFDGRRLRLTRADSACDWFYEVSDGERFIFDEGAF